jgi:hypothetical protein
MRSVRSAVELAKELAEKAKARSLAEKAKKNELGLEEPDQADAGTPHPLEVAIEVVDEQPVRRRGAPKGPRGLMPVHHPNRDFFLCDLFDYALKDDGVSMEAPIFTLATKPDTSVWHWESKDGSRAITVTPSVKGRARVGRDSLIFRQNDAKSMSQKEKFDRSTAP